MYICDILNFYRLYRAAQHRPLSLFCLMSYFPWLYQIRMQAQGSLLQGSMMSNFINIYQTEGTRGLWRVSAFITSCLSLRHQWWDFKACVAIGCLNISLAFQLLGFSFLSCFQGVIPTAQRAAIVVGVELPVYDITKKHLILSGLMGDTVLTHFMWAFLAVLACWCKIWIIKTLTSWVTLFLLFI